MANKNEPKSIQPLAVYSPEEAAQLIRVGRRTIYRLIDEKELQVKMINDRPKILGEKLLNYLGSQTYTGEEK